jgi:hypothetical protein
MAQLRTQYPGPCWNGLDWKQTTLDPKPAYGTRPNTHDYPTVLKHNSSASSSMTRNVTFYDGSTYSLPNTCPVNGGNVDKFYSNMGDNYSAGYYIHHGTGVGASFLYGHQGPASSSGTIQAWARNVTGFSWEYKMGGTNSAGIRLKNLILLYKKKDWTTKFAGLWLAKNFAPAEGVEYRTLGWNPFNTRTNKSLTGGSVSLTSMLRQSPTNWVTNNALTFQGIWFEFDKQDSASFQFTNPYFIYNTKLNYDTHQVASTKPDDKIVLPVQWRFDNAHDKLKPLKLT